MAWHNVFQSADSARMRAAICPCGRRFDHNCQACMERGTAMASATLKVQPIEVNFVLKDKIYEALKQAITQMNIYAEPSEPRLDERQLSLELGVSRTPIREAIAR